jgi:hypothetical protein
MKRLELCIFILLSVLIWTDGQSESNDPKASMITLCYRLWKHSSFGWDETERAAWVIRDPDGIERWVEWEFTNEHHAATWKGMVPKGVVAQFHTHPGFTYPQPSKQDIRVARQLRLFIYTISILGIWRVGPDGKVTKEANEHWYKRVREN